MEPGFHLPGDPRPPRQLGVCVGKGPHFQKLRLRGDQVVRRIVIAGMIPGWEILRIVRARQDHRLNPPPRERIAERLDVDVGHRSEVEVGVKRVLELRRRRDMDIERGPLRRLRGIAAVDRMERARHRDLPRAAAKIVGDRRLDELPRRRAEIERPPPIEVARRRELGHRRIPRLLQRGRKLAVHPQIGRRPGIGRQDATSPGDPLEPQRHHDAEIAPGDLRRGENRRRRNRLDTPGIAEQRRERLSRE